MLSATICSNVIYLRYIAYKLHPGILYVAKDNGKTTIYFYFTKFSIWKKIFKNCDNNYEISYNFYYIFRVSNIDK